MGEYLVQAFDDFFLILGRKNQQERNEFDAQIIADEQIDCWANGSNFDR